jgi:hypothetical protein
MLPSYADGSFGYAPLPASFDRRCLEDCPKVVRWVEESLSKQIISHMFPIVKNSSG